MNISTYTHYLWKLIEKQHRMKNELVDKFDYFHSFSKIIHGVINLNLTLKIKEQMGLSTYQLPLLIRLLLYY